MSTEVKLPVNPGRVLFGLSRIGYTPDSAICDIVDNAVSAGAKNISIVIKKREAKGRDTLRNNVSEYLIVDDGKGMDEAGIQNSLTLGASDTDYAPHSLSKFGLGLKSAAFSQGDELDVISSPGGGAPFIKYRVSLPSIRDRYFATRLDLTASDNALLIHYLPDGRGTLVRVGEVRREGHPAIKDTLQQLRDRMGVIYYYFLQEESLQITLENDKVEQIIPFDVLQVNEANANGDLDELTWNGKEVRWIEHPKPIKLDDEFNVRGQLEATQLPHPPSFNTPSEPNAKNRVGKHYKIEAKNYGIYIYRNKRLISWADTLDGAFGYDQDLYAFRGRLLINDSADNAFNIDIKKTALVLSEQAKERLHRYASEYKRQSRKAWERAKSLVKAAQDNDPYKRANELADEIKTPDVPAGTPPISPTREAEKDEEITRQMQENIRQEAEQVAAMKAAVQGDSNPEDVVKTPDELFEETLTGSPDEDFATKVKRVPFLPGDQLWEPYYDPQRGHIVRINRFHRFAKLLLEDNDRNPDLQVLFELFLYQAASAEVQFRRAFETIFPSLKMSDDKLVQVMSEFRRFVANGLTTMCMQLDDKLPRSE